MKMNKKGFTLVELLAVIVILAVVMLIATTAVGPLMTKSRKSALGTEGVSLVDAAKTAYQAEQMAGKIKPTDSVCFDLKWLNEYNYFSKGASDSYSGSVLVTYAGGKYSYKFWISNGTYAFGMKADGTAMDGINPNSYDVESNTVVNDGASASADCKSATGIKLFKSGASSPVTK